MVVSGRIAPRSTIGGRTTRQARTSGRNGGGALNPATGRIRRPHAQRHDRRLRLLQGPPAPERGAARPGARPWSASSTGDGLRLAGDDGPDRGGARLRPTRAFDVPSWPSRTPSEATSVRSSTSTGPLLHRRQDRPVRGGQGARSTSARSTSSSGRGYVITVRHGEAANLQPARQRLGAGRTRTCSTPGPAAVAWAILDQVVDDYEPVIAGIDDDIEEVEQEVFEGRAESTPADLLPEARGDRVPPRRRPAARAAGGARARGLPADAGRASPLLPRRRRPCAADRRADPLAARAPDHDPRGEPVADQRAAEQGRAGDLGLGGDHRRADLPRQRSGG